MCIAYTAILFQNCVLVRDYTYKNIISRFRVDLEREAVVDVFHFADAVRLTQVDFAQLCARQTPSTTLFNSNKSIDAKTEVKTYCS